RLVLQALQVLKGQRLDGVDLAFGQVRAADDVGVDIESRGQVAGQGRAPEPRVQGADALVAIDAEVVQRQRQLAAVALAGPAGDEVREDRGDAVVRRQVVGAAGRDEKVQRRRAHVFHALGEQ